jgi:hypothetical protein
MNSEEDYVYGWIDCLEALMTVDGEGELRKLMPELCSALKKRKYEKIRKDLGIYNLF